MVDLDEKKRILVERQQSMAKKQRTIMIVIFLVIAVAGVGYSYYNTISNPLNEGGDYNIGSEVSYEGENIQMTPLELTKEGEYVTIPIEQVKENSIIYTEFRGKKERDYYNGLNYLPMMAFVAPAGRIVVATSLCEPCYATKFFIEDNILVCDVCATRWRLSDLMGQSGGCTSYPPEVLKYTVKDDKLVIDSKQLEEWVPRAFKDEMKDI